MLSSQRIHLLITTHQRLQSAKHEAGHLATNCVNLPTGARVTSKVPKIFITNAMSQIKLTSYTESSK